MGLCWGAGSNPVSLLGGRKAGEGGRWVVVVGGGGGDTECESQCD